MSVTDCLLENEPDLIVPPEMELNSRRRTVLAIVAAGLLVAAIVWIAMAA